MITKTHKLFDRLILLGAIPFGILMVYGDKIFTIVFGADWETAGVFAGYMSFMAFTSFISVSFTSLFRVMRQEKMQFFINLAGSTFLCLGMFTALNLGDEQYLVLTFGFISSAIQLCAVGIALRLAGINPIMPLVKIAGSIGLVALTLYFLKALYQ
jgi:O-antigen/teichoic acid export membrane protein